MCNEIVDADVNDFFKCNEADVCVCFSSVLNATSMLVMLLLLIFIQTRRQCANLSSPKRIFMALQRLASSQKEDLATPV